MARLLLVPVAALTWMAGLFLLVIALASLWRAMPAPPFGAAPADMRDAAYGAVLVAVLAMPPGLGVALALRRAGRAAREAAALLALLLLMAPVPDFSFALLNGAWLHGAWLHGGSLWPGVLALAAATARGAALVLLVLQPGLYALPPGLQRAAVLAGARPFQAWRHAVLAPLLPYLAAAFAAAFVLALVTSLAADMPARPVVASLWWTIPACLLLAGAGLAALIRLLLPRREA
jgi:ABC-type spermidine/putrescine transport system permease subunit II